jgi:hypothetical protein
VCIREIKVRIKFLQQVVNERGEFAQGRVITVRSLPMGWDALVRDGAIEITADVPAVEAADVRPAGVMRGRGRRRTANVGR